MADSLLCTSQLTKRYGAVTVLHGVSFEVCVGEIHGLLGANGAGKSTLAKIISGLTAASDGSMTLAGTTFCPANKQDAEKLGVEIVQQELNLIATLSVAENLQLTCMPNVAGVIRQGVLHQRARQILDRFGLGDISTSSPVAALGVGHQQMIEIAGALSRECRLLILDEPTAALSAGEADQLFEWLETLRRRGVAIIYISHRLDEVTRLTDRITILGDGKFVCTRDTATTKADEMVSLMSGGALQASSSGHASFSTDEPAMRVEGMSRGFVQNVSFAVNRGERLGIAGLVGSGRTELLRAVFGADIATSGHVLLGGDASPRSFRSPAEAVKAGLAMVTEDRKQNGLLLPHSVRMNATLASMKTRFSSAGMIRSAVESHTAASMCEALEIRCASLEQSVETLSGGNQQKVAVAKWLIRDANVFLFDEPTRGIDVASRRRIYRLFDTLAAEGKGIVIASSDLDELFETCDRIAVMSAGRLVKTFGRGEWSEARIMQAAFSGYSERAWAESNASDTAS